VKFQPAIFMLCWVLPLASVNQADVFLDLLTATNFLYGFSTSNGIKTMIIKVLFAVALFGSAFADIPGSAGNPLRRKR
jgi:hypothetical protein